MNAAPLPLHGVRLVPCCIQVFRRASRCAGVSSWRADAFRRRPLCRVSVVALVSLSDLTLQLFEGDHPAVVSGVAQPSPSDVMLLFETR